MAAISVRRRTDCFKSGSVFQLYKPVFFLGWILCLITGGSLSAAPANVQVLEANDYFIRIRFSNCTEANSNCVDYAKDSSQIISRTVQVGIPPEGSVSLAGAMGSRDKTVAIDLTTYSTTTTLASVSEPYTVRGYRLVNLTVFPMTSSGMFDEIEVSLSFENIPKQNHEFEADPMFDQLFRASVVNFEQMKGWGKAQRVEKSRTDAALAVELAGEWIKVYVNQTGLHALTGAQLEQAGLSLTGLSSDQVRIFNGGGLRVPMPNEQARPEFTEIATYVQDGNDGQFNANDKIYFYGEAVDRWLYLDGGVARWENNSYTDANVYWIPISAMIVDPPVRMATIDGTPTGTADTIISEVRGRTHAEKDSLLVKDPTGHVEDYYRFYWTNGSSIRLFVNTPGLMSSSTANVSVSARSGGVTASFNSFVDPSYQCNRFACSFSTTHLGDGMNQINLNFLPDGNHEPGFDYLDVTYRRRLIPVDDRLEFVCEDVTGTAQIALADNFSSTPTIFDVTDPLHPVIIINAERASGVLGFLSDLSQSEWNHFVVTPLTAAYAPFGLEAAEVTDLRASNQQSDMLIITHPSFVNALNDYVQYRSSDNMSIRVVTVNEIMDNFSFGLYDPIALRDFLKYTYENYPSPKPSIALMVGDANHDFLDVQLTGVVNYVPAFIHALPNLDVSYSDDNFVYFDKYGLLDPDTSLTKIGDRGVDMFIARWPVSSTAEIARVIDKIRLYESNSDLGYWRSRITLVADDEFGGDFNNETFHTTDSEKLDTLVLPRAYNRDKIYLIEYPFVNGDKPAVNDAIVNSFNRGSLIVNYVGHGNPDVWSHEHVFQRGSDLPRLNNYDKLPLVFAASCAIGFFDDPRREGMAEDFLVMPQGGAIGIISATRLVYAGDNAVFNRAVCNILFNEPELSICQAMFAGKLERQYLNDSTMFAVPNDRAYAFFGDPLLKLGLPELEIRFDEYPDTLVALGQHHVSGYLVDSDDSPVNLDGELFINLYDSDRNMSYHLLSDPSIKIDYTKPGPTLFRGRATISGGEFSFDFVAPLDIGYGGQKGKLSLYSVLGDAAGIGATGPLVISDQVTVSTDTVGPQMTYSFSSHANFVSGDPVSLNESLELTLADSSGINLAGGLGHGIALEIDGDPSATVMLNELFEYETDDFTTGKIAYSLENLEAGVHQFKLRAWDNANNSSSVEFAAELVPSVGFSIADLLNYPNPMSNSTTFYFALAEPTERFVLDIFTLSGRRIRSFNRTDLPADNYPNETWSLTWDGRDFDGDRVATGVYLYKAVAHGTLSGETVESFGKIVVIN